MIFLLQELAQCELEKGIRMNKEWFFHPKFKLNAKLKSKRVLY